MPVSTILASTSRRTITICSLAPVFAAAALAASPAEAQSVCTVGLAGVIDCTASATTPAPPGSGTIDVTGSVDPLVVTLADGYVANGPVTLGTVGGADITIISEGVSTIQNSGPGLTADSSGAINAEVTNVSTTGDNATAVALTAVDEVIFTSDGTISTLGDNSDGVFIEGQTVTADLNLVRTEGVNAQGVEIIATDGPISLSFDTIETNGDLSSASVLRGTGDVTLTGRALSTQGTDAIAFDISNDAAACVLLGTGGCDVTVAAEQVTTEGFGGIGGLVASSGDTNINIGVLRTGGDEAAGLDLSADPASCVTIGTGACDTAFTVGELTTAGDRSPGAIVRGSGDITADVGVLRTGGNEAAGLDLASDPTACAVLGAGACDTSFSVGELTTSGAGSTGALVRSAGGVSGSIGVLRTEGDDAAGIDIATDPAACLILGAGACDVGLVADDVSTGGDGAAGVLIASTGGVVTDLGRVATAGDDSAGLSIVQDPAACLAIGPGACRVQAQADDVDTGGDNSPGVVVESPGPVDVDAGEVTTGGDNSDAVHVDGGDEPVTLTAGAIVTTGNDSDGVEVVTVNGDQTLNVGPIHVSGLGSDAVVATSVCGDIAVNARDDIVSVQGNAIIASTGCRAAVTTAPGADVAGATGGIIVTSGTGALLDIGGGVTASAGPAIDVDGAAAEVIIRPTGSVAGAIDLTPNDDSLANAGLFAPVGTSDFGAGTDLFTNAGEVRVRGTAALQGLELLANEGVVDLVDGAADDSLTISGDFTGGAGSTLLLDVAAGTAGTPADRLVVGGTAGGTTAIELNLLGNVAVANPAGVVLVDAQTATSGAFTLEGPTRVGLVDYSLRQQDGNVLLVALPNAFALEPLLAGRLGLDFWYQSADAWSESAAPRRANLAADRPGMSFWVQGYGSTEESGERRDLDVFGTSSPVDLRFDTDRRGVQAGIDFRTGAGFAFGITGGYQHAASELASGSEFDLEGHNIGAYLLYGQPSGLYAELLAKADFFDVRVRNGALFGGAEPEGKSYGVEGELGYRMTFGGFDLDLGAGLAYVSTDLDGFEASGFRYEYDDAKSLRGRLGFRASAGGSGLAPYLDGKVLHEFNGDNDTVLSSGGFDLDLADRGKRTWGRGELGLAGGANGSGGFVALWGEIGDVEGYGLRLGFRF